MKKLLLSTAVVGMVGALGACASDSVTTADSEYNTPYSLERTAGGQRNVITNERVEPRVRRERTFKKMQSK